MFEASSSIFRECSVVGSPSQFSFSIFKLDWRPGSQWELPASWPAACPVFLRVLRLSLVSEGLRGLPCQTVFGSNIWVSLLGRIALMLLRIVLWSRFTGFEKSSTIKRNGNFWMLFDSLLEGPLAICPSNHDNLGRLSQRFIVLSRLKIVSLTAPTHQDHAQTHHQKPSDLLFMEKQDRAFCLVHSSNMAIGYHVFSGDNVFTHIHLEDTLKRRNLNHNRNLRNFTKKILASSTARSSITSCTICLGIAIISSSSVQPSLTWTPMAISRIKARSIAPP